MIKRSYFLLVLLASICFPAAFGQTLAPDGPGGTPYWPRANKQGIGTALTDTSHVWFTVGGGTLNEVFYPAVDKANTRDLELVVTDGKTFCDFETADTEHAVEYPDDSALIVRQVNTAKSGRYKITKTYIADPARDVVLIRAELTVLMPGPALSAFVFYDPSLNNTGLHDTGYTQGSALIAIKRPQDTKEAELKAKEEAEAAAKAAASTVSGWSLTGAPGATPGQVATALVSEPAFTATSNGFFEAGSGGSDLKKYLHLIHQYTRAENGNVVQIGKLPESFGQGHPVTLALGFAETAQKALSASQGALATPFGKSSQTYADGWHGYLSGLKLPEQKYRQEFLRCAMVLKAHEDKLHPGALVASINNPWGEVTAATNPDVGGYHLVWVRDLYHSATAFIAMGDIATANRALTYLLNVQQRPDGTFPQDSWLTGQPYQGSLQMDEQAFPIIMAWQLGRTDQQTYSRHLKPAADFIVAKGPWTPQDRWEESDGYSPATIAAELSGLICAADIASRLGDTTSAAVYTKTADTWFGQLMGWTVTTTGKYAPEYFVKITQHGKPNAGEMVTLTSKKGTWDERDIVDESFLELVRLGVLKASDRVVLETLDVVDKVNKVDTPFGPGWRRYTHDGYGEKADGEEYTGTGIGRVWPLLAGERGEYDIASGGDGRLYLDTMLGQTNEAGMLPEQVWDQPVSPNSLLVFGKPNGSANPMGWGAGQFIRLAMSVQEHRVVEMPSIVREHFQKLQ